MTCTRYVAIWILLIMAVVAIVFGLMFGLANEQEQRRTGAVASNGAGCAEIGGQVLDEGGSASDAAIATMLCEGVVLPESLGVGGGFIATIYTKATGKMESLISSETAPAAATEDMFIGQSTVTGPRSCAVPSQIYGFWKLHLKHGKLPWERLFQPTIEMCRSGILVSKYLAHVLLEHERLIRKDISMAEIFINPETNNVYVEGEIMYQHVLADTLEIIAKEGPEALYRGGRLGRMLVEDIQSLGGIITETDLQSYDVRWEEPLRSHMANGYELFTSPLPSSGAVLTFILNVMKPLYTSHRHLYWHRLIETFKHAYGLRSRLGDIHFEPSAQEMYKKLLDVNFADKVRRLIQDDRTFEDLAYYGANYTNVEDHGSAHMSVLAPNGDAVSVTSTINDHLGSKVRSRQTGIILNNQMDDFSTPGLSNIYNISASPFNYIKPGKRPMSSSCPSIILDRVGNVALVVGSAGGPLIATAVAQTILNYFTLGEPIFEAVNAAHLHHQLVPMHVAAQEGTRNHTLNYLHHLGHHIHYRPKTDYYPVVTAIGNMDGEPQPVSDRRRIGSAVVVEL